MHTVTVCLGCGEPFDYAEKVCPNCDWDLEEFRDRGRHGLSKPGHCEPEDTIPGGPPPGPAGLRGL